MTPLKVNTAIMCEFLTETPNNKHTLVNVIPGDMILHQFPSNIPVAFYFEVTPKLDEEADYIIEIKFGKKRAGYATAHVAFEAGKQGVIALPFGLLAVEAPGAVVVSIGREGERPTVLLKKQLIAAGDATSSNDS